MFLFYNFSLYELAEKKEKTLKNSNMELRKFVFDILRRLKITA